MNSYTLSRTGRSVVFLVCVLNAGLGIASALLLNHYITKFPTLIAPKWYESYWLPLWVATLCYVIEAFFAQHRARWLFGLLVTAPPYGWFTYLLTVEYVHHIRDYSLTEYLKSTMPPLLLALSGAILNPVITWLMARLRTKVQMSAAGS